MKKLLLMAAGALFLTACSAGQTKFNPVFGKGDPNPHGAHFTGKTYLTALNGYDDTIKLPAANVTFEPGARTDWHTHTGGQVLLATNGEGRYQIRGKELEILHSGDIVVIPPDTEHWHGAAPNSWFSHVALTPNAPNNRAIWLEPITDAQYK